MIDSSALPRSSPAWAWIERWRLSVPAAALGWLWLLAACWGQEPGWVSATVVTAGGWSLAVLSRAVEFPNEIVKLRSGLASLVGAAVLALMLWREPRGLAMTFAGLCILAAFQLVLSAGSSRPGLVRFAFVMAALAAGSTLWTALFDWPLVWRAGLTAILIFTTAQLVQSPPTAARLALPRGVVRGLVFAAAIVAPTGWYAHRGLVFELARRENAAFVVVAIFAAVLVQPRDPGDQSAAAGTSGRSKFPTAALLLLSVLAIAAAAIAQHPPPRLIFAAAALTALILAAGVQLDRKNPVAAKAVRESALLASWLTLPAAVLLIR